MGLGTHRFEVWGVTDRTHPGHELRCSLFGDLRAQVGHAVEPQRMRIEEERTDWIALIRPGARLS